MNGCKRIGLAFTAFILMASLLTGCWNRRELNAISVVLAMGIDWVDEQYQLTVQVSDPSQMSINRSGERSPAIIFSERAPTIFEALRKITTKASRRMYLSHMRIVIINEKIAERGLRNPLDFLFRDHEVRPDFFMAVAKGCDAKDILAFVTPMEVLPAIDLYKSLKVSESSWAPTSAVNVVDMMQKVTKDGIEPVLTGITLIGNRNKGMKIDNVKQPKAYAEYKYTGIGVLLDDRIVGWLGESDSKGYSYVSNIVRSTVGHVRCPDGRDNFVVEIYKSHAEIIPSIKDGKPHVKVKMKSDANIGEYHCSADLGDEKVFSQMQQVAREEQRTTLEHSIRHVQRKYGADIYGFGEAFHRKYPKQWNKWKKQWPEIFKNDLQVEVVITTELHKTGKILNTIHKQP
ncbi:Ger(x)C family spore germination protein [Paenibacillus glycanilyticus]|uniref:Ger(x)C family spore germination protein n=1 Tax=Paenibacillus glycanilyticus TaxID=126569 RepID=UPI003EC0C95B